MKRLLISFFLLCSYQVSCATEQIVVTSHRPNYKNMIEVFVTMMSNKYGFDKDELRQQILAVEPDQDVINKISPPKKKKIKPQTETPEEIAFKFEKWVSNGVNFWVKNKDAIDKASQDYGVNPEILVGLIGIETNYGTYTGQYNVFRTLVSLSFYGKRRQGYFRDELEQYLVVSRDKNWDTSQIKGSYAGAIAIPQFMPSAVVPFSVDGNNDGTIDLFGDPADAICSAANFLVQHGWDKNGPIAVQVHTKQGKKTFISRVLPGPKPTIWLKMPNYNNILHYNPSDAYVMSIFILSEKIRDRHDAYKESIPNADELHIPDMGTQPKQEQ